MSELLGSAGYGLIRRPGLRVAVLAGLLASACGDSTGTGAAGGTGGAPSDGGRTVAGGGQGGGGATRTCGNGTLEGVEQCDDGNTSNGDGCGASCVVEPGWSCDGTLCSPICGDQIVVGGEQCDDGNTASGDGCSSACVLEFLPGANCASPIVASSGFVLRGTNIAQFGDDLDFGTNEEFDVQPGCADVDGALNSSPDIVFRVSLSAGQRLTSRNFGTEDLVWQVTSACPPQQGSPYCLASFDGTLAEEQETGLNFIAPSAGEYYVIVESQFGTASIDPFDQANSLDPNSNFEIHFDFATCGNGNSEIGEECDDGDTMSGDGCSSTCTTEAGYLCANRTNQPSSCTNAATSACSTITELPIEFRGTDWPSLENDYVFDDPSCQPLQTSNAYGFDAAFGASLAQGETLRVRQLANVDTVFHLFASTNCSTIQAGAPCTASREFNEGDGLTYTATSSGNVVVAVELFTDVYEPTLPYHIIVDKSVCGNGTTDFDETCDDGNVVSGDGCSASCEIEPSFDCPEALPTCVACSSSGATLVNTLPSDLNAAPFEATGTATTDEFHGGFGCTVADPDAGSDVVFRAALAAGQTVRIRQVSPNFDGVLHIIEPSDCGNGSQCVADLDGSEASSPEAEGTTFTATQVGDIYLVVESKDKASQSTPYDVLIDSWSCGDGIAHEREPCDDGNPINGDGCSSSCQVEPGYRCEGSPSACFDVTGCTTLACYLECNGGCPCPGMLVTGSYAGPDTIPDQGQLEVTIDLNAAGTVVRRVATSWAVTHTFDADLDFSLRGPDLNERGLCSDNGANGDSFSNTRLVDGVSSSIVAGAGPFTGAFRPEIPLTRFAGETADGLWTLRIKDDAQSDEGTLQAFDIAVCTE